MNLNKFLKKCLNTTGPVMLVCEYMGTDVDTGVYKGAPSVQPIISKESPKTQVEQKKLF